MKNHNESFSYQIKSIFFKLNKLGLVLSLSLLMILQTGCTSKDEEAPVITNVQVKDNVVTIEASDNVEVTGYISVSNPRQPSLTDENWLESNTITLVEDGTYYIWVKDASDNLAQHTETIEMSYNLALKFDHLNWLTPAEGTRVVDGVTYNLTELKAEYGDLYRLVEPLTNEEIESRFEYLARFMELQMDKANSTNNLNWDVFSGLKMSNDLSPVLAEMFYSTHSLIANSVDIKIKPYIKYYHYISTTGRYEMSFPLNFTSEKGFFGVGTDIISKVTLDEKTLFVRYFILRNEITLKTYEQLGLEPEYVIENWDWN